MHEFDQFEDSVRLLAPVQSGIGYIGVYLTCFRTRFFQRQRL